MDEVENPELPKAGESSPTLPPVEDDDGDSAVASRSSEPSLLAESGAVSPKKATALPETRTASTAKSRPVLKREASAPPPQQPPTVPLMQDSGDFSQENPDSLTLADLKRLRSTFPDTQNPPPQQLSEYDRVYDFDYQDAQSLPVELEEWFSYSEEEESKLRKCKSTFDEVWNTSEGRLDWMAVTEDERRAFVLRHITMLRDTTSQSTSSLLMMTYIALGVWSETAGRNEGCVLEDLFKKKQKGGARLEDYRSSSLQIQWIVAMADTLHACGGLKVIWNKLRQVIEETFSDTPPDSLRPETQVRRGEESLDLWCCLTLMYIFVEVARTTGGSNGTALRADLLKLEPNLLNQLTQIIGRLRWDESAPVPLTKMLLLAWKTILISFGGISDVEQIKAAFRDDKGEQEMDARGQPIITASPLDYHLFRQEINSKYPAYRPPPPIFPLEPENNSILPPLKHRRSSFAASNDSAFGNAPSVGTHSIMHQPVHIATPAPSPPPSPAGPGKAGKKQNYQTNQMFPFLYPPLDPSSNQLGGKGSTELQDALVGRQWGGSDIPASILEAAELFAKRMRATRAMKQMWEARVDYMKYERGWKAGLDRNDKLDLADDDAQFQPKSEQSKPAEQSTEHTKGQGKLDAVTDFYRDALPHLQSVVIVLLKAVLQNVTDLVTKNNGQNGLQPGFDGSNGLNGVDAPKLNGVQPSVGGDGMENTTAEELDKLRGQEICAKALSAILILLLKWFKVTHVLQYEYMTQLLLDSNYVPLILKLWQTQEIGRACHFQLDRDDKGFFYYCRVNSRHPPIEEGESKSVECAKEDQKEGEEEEEDEEEDDSAPPPIKMKRDPSSPPSDSPPQPAPDFQHPPEVDELGYPTTPIPTTPLTKFSYRNLFTAINYLRILQKITSRKTHRALLLVSYKSSNHLRKTLKIPVRELRFYTLKLYKSQVPFCGRKWRQSNMRIITAVWLSVPAELRDSWLSGGGGGMGGACVGDVDGTVEDALPLEQSLRALTHWWNVRQFPDVMGVDQGLVDEESNFFARELAKIEIVTKVAEGAGEDGAMIGEDAQAQQLQQQQQHQEGWQGPIEGY
nr:factor arrest protein 11 [Quercus suber]